MASTCHKSSLLDSVACCICRNWIHQGLARKIGVNLRESDPQTKTANRATERGASVGQPPGRMSNTCVHTAWRDAGVVRLSMSRSTRVHILLNSPAGLQDKCLGMICINECALAYGPWLYHFMNARCNVEGICTLRLTGSE